MRCYNCGYEAEGTICPACGAPLATYRDILTLSAAYYNDGLDRANSRDLTGAIRSLSMCLKLDKNNISARNLLGLVFYETGEAVHAITQWVISKNLQGEENPVDTYLDDLRANPARLDSMNRAIKKYNFALRSARKGQHDAARIHLKKSLQLNPGLLKARQLLALLYIRRKDYARARFELMQCQQIDVASDKTIRYLKEIDRVVREKNLPSQAQEKSAKGQQAVAYRSGNDTIIQPARVFFSSGGALSIFSVIFGVILGVLAVVFLVTPARVRQAQIESNERIAAISEESDSKTARLTEYERQVGEMEQQMMVMQGRIDAFEGQNTAGSSMDNLMRAAADYLSGESGIETLAQQMEYVSAEDVGRMQNPSYTALYDAVVATAGKELSEHFFTRGVEAVRDGLYTDAVRYYALAVQYDETDADALYNLAEATRLSGDMENAKLLYDRVISTFPGTRRAADAEIRMIEMNN